MKNVFRSLASIYFFACITSQAMAQAESFYGISNPQNPQVARKGKPAYWGVFFWEFPDGTYKIYKNLGPLKMNSDEFKARASHSSCKKHNGQGARVYLTPINSGDLPIIRNATSESQIKTANGLVNHANNNDVTRGIVVDHSLGKNELTYGSEFRVVVRYKDMNRKGGKLIILFDKTNFDKHGKPVFRFNYPSIHNGEEEVLGEAKKSYNPQIILNRSVTGVNPYEYADEDFKVFKIDGKKSGLDENRFFFTLKSLNLGNEHIDKVRRVYFKVVWIPNAGGKQSEKEVSLRLRSSYDPNNIVAPKSSYQQCKCIDNQKLSYRVNFENKGKDPAYKVIVKLIVGNGLDIGSFAVDSTSPGYALPPQSADTCRGCLVQQEIKDTVILTFNDIGLQGRNWFRKKSSRGSAVFSISKPEHWNAESVVKGIIFFDHNKGVKTNAAKTIWRKKILYAKAGYSFGLNQPGLPDSLVAEGNNKLNLIRNGIPYESGPITGGVSYEDCPVGSGPIWGWGADYGQIQFAGDKVYWEDTDYWYNGLYNISFLDAKFISGYQFSRFFRFTGGIGVAVPTRINHTFSPYNSWTGVDDIFQVQYGFLQKKGYVFPSHFPFGTPPYFRPKFGLHLQWGAEIGLLRRFAIGMEQQIRYIPKFYPYSEYLVKRSELFSNINVYAKIAIPICWLKCKINGLF